MTLKRCTVSVSLLLTCFLPLFSSAQQAGRCEGRAALNRFERDQFLEVSDGQRAEISAQFLAATGCSQPMLDALTRLGAKIDFADKPSGYALVTVQREKLLATLDIPGIAYAYTRDDDRMYYQDPAAKIPQSDRKAEPIPTITIPYPRVATTLAPDGPYFATDEIGLSTLWKQHPEADGRGVRVAIPDEGFDLLHPALQQARDAAGNIVPKVADLGTLTTPEEDSGWVRFSSPITTTNGSFDAAGRTWTAPEGGTYRFGIFKHDLVLGPEGNSRAQKLSLSVGVLWNPQTNHVWVDTDGDGSFRNQRPLGDYGAAQDTDWFGTKQGDDDNRIPFGVKIDAAKDAVYIRIGGEHGALVSGPLAANTWTDGLFNGAAPSAQLIDDNLSRATLVAAMVQMAARSDVDVLNRSGGLGRAGYTGNSEGIEDFAQHVLGRLIAVYGKPLVAYSAAPGTIHVNDFAGPKMLKRNRQLAPPYLDTINSFVWNLPNGLVNTVLAPSANLETDSRYDPLDIPLADGKRESYSDTSFDPPAPDGYVIGANNSPTIPVVSGVLADLISEARREDVRTNVIRLNNAIFTGTKLLPGFRVSRQGYGLINAAQSWDQLAKMAKADDPANNELTSFTVSRMEAGKSVEVQGFHADLTKPGEKLEGEIWVARRGGYAGGRKYSLSLRGNDGDYELLDHEATLERDKPVRVRFRTNGKSGWNIVFLELRDVAADVVMQDIPLSVKVPDVPEKIAPGVNRYESEIPPLLSEYRYVRVGDEAQAVRYAIRAPYVGSDSILSAPGIRSRDVTPPGDPVDAAHHVGPMETLESLVVNNSPGTQEIFWENRGRPEYATQYDGPAPDVPIHAELTVTKYAVSIHRGVNDTVSVANELAAIDGKVELYNAALKTESLMGDGLHAMGEINVTLPSNLAEWRFRLTPNATFANTSDVYVLNCVGKDAHCYVAATQEITPTMKTLTIEDPAAGTWKIVVRSRDQVQHSATYSIHEAFLTPAGAPIEAADNQHEHGASWTLPLPKIQSDARYTAFRIAGTPGVASEKNGLVIAMTPLDRGTP